MKLLKSTATFSGITFLSRIAGYARDLVLARMFGASMAMDAFLIAYRIPNFLRRIFAEGSFQQAFVPVFTEVKQQDDPRALKLLLDHVAGALAAVLLLVTALGMFAAPMLTGLFAPGTTTEPEKFQLTSSMLRITFPYLAFISLTALAAGVLNSFGRFALPALTPVLHNLAVIAAALWLAPLLDVPVKALAWGVFAAGAIQLGVQWYALKRMGLLPRFRLDFAYPGVQRVMRLMLPTIFGSSAAQINLLFATIYASLLATGSQTWLYLTDRLIEFPQGMIGVALATVILPHLSRKHAEQDAAGYAATLDWGLRMAFLIALPATLGLAVMAEPITATLYQYGKFTDYDTRMAGLSLSAFAFGLPGFMLAKVLAPAFYARQDTRTPVRAAVITVAANVALMTLIVLPLWKLQVEGGHAGIALCTAFAGTLNAWLLWRALRREGSFAPRSGWTTFLRRLGIACAVMVLVLVVARWYLGPWQPLLARWRLVHLAWTLPLGALTYALALYAAGLRFRHLREE